MQIRAVANLCVDREGLRAAYLAAQVLIEKRWHEYPAPSWDDPAVLAFAGEECVAGVNYRVDDKQRFASVQFAFCNPDHPPALTAALIAFRKVLRSQSIGEVRWRCHPDNAPMMKLAEKLRLRPSTLSYRAVIQ